jgi:hypothetical protein
MCDLAESMVTAGDRLVSQQGFTRDLTDGRWRRASEVSVEANRGILASARKRQWQRRIDPA